jgi:taurine dioxygenase
MPTSARSSTPSNNPTPDPQGPEPTASALELLLHEIGIFVHSTALELSERSLSREICVHNFIAEPVTGVLGAQISGVDLAEVLSDDTIGAIRQALLDHHVLFFRDQHLTPEQQMTFGRRFGELDQHPFVDGQADHPEVLEIITQPDDSFNFGGGWHTDVTFLEEPDLGSILYAVEVPAAGGDTLFANQHAAYDALSDTMKELLSDLTALHSPSAQYGADGVSTKSKAMETKNVAAAGGIVEHPVIRTHPESGKLGLYVNGAFVTKIKGMRRDESSSILDFLYRHAISEAFTCRFRWEPGSIAMWDNRSVMHYALHDYAGEYRHMRRITIKGDRPY